MNNNNTSDVPIQDAPHVSKFNVEEPKKKNQILPIVIGSVTAFFIFLVVWIFLLKKSPFDFIKNRMGRDGSGSRPENVVQNPITGAEIDEKDAEAWKDIRPLAVMINNHIDARPQSGLIYADFVYEVVAEGGITRFISFYLNETPEKIGPVRSTREYYLVLVKEMGDAMLMHEGYSPQAKLAIDEWLVRSLFRGGASATANWRDESLNVAFEHTLYTNGVKLREHGDSLGWAGNREFKVWKFDGSEKYQDKQEAWNLTIDFWYEGDYSAIFKYNPEEKHYLRFMGYDADGNPAPHVDRETKEQITVENVIVQFVAETPIIGDDKSRLEYELVGSGTGLIFVDGRVVEATWTKEDRDARTMFYDLDGEEIEFSRGKFWISIVPDRNVEQVVYN